MEGADGERRCCLLLSWDFFFFGLNYLVVFIFFLFLVMYIREGFPFEYWVV